jgi:hypothetical protein
LRRTVGIVNAWANSIVVPVPTAPYSSAREASRPTGVPGSSDDLAFGSRPVPWVRDELFAEYPEAVALLRFDGAIHVVLTDATYAQARDLIRRLDEHRGAIGERIGLPCPGVFVTIVGEPLDSPEAHDSAITVVTPDALLAVAALTA